MPPALWEGYCSTPQPGYARLRFVSSDERDIFQFLKTWSSTFINASEISRRAGSKKRAHEEPNWAKPILMNMAERGILEADIQGRYRIRPVRRKKRGKWVAPDIAKILEENNLPVPGESAPDPAAGVPVDGAVADATAAGEGEAELATDEYYEQL